MGKKRHSESAPAGTDPVLVLTISLFVILLSFFILLNSLAVPDEDRRRAAIGSLNENFGVLSGGFSLFEEEGSQGSDGRISKMSGLLDFSDLVKNKADQPLVTTEAGKTTVILAGDLVFEPASARIRASAFPVLNRLARAVTETASPLDIAGFMSKETGGAGQVVSPRELSAFRALSVMTYFTEKGGVDPKLLTAYGWGEYKPAVSVKVPDARTVNERMELTFTHTNELERPEGAFTFRNFFFRVLDRK